MSKKVATASKYDGIKVTVDNVDILFENLTPLEKFIVELSGISNALLTLITGLITSLSINYLTNFTNIDASVSGASTFLSVLRLIFCLLFNIFFIRFAIKDISINDSVYIKSDILPKNREQARCEQIFNLTYKNMSTLKREFVFSIVFGGLMIVCIIIDPFITYYLK